MSEIEVDTSPVSRWKCQGGCGIQISGMCLGCLEGARIVNAQALAAAELRGKRAAVSRLLELARLSKWLDTTGSKEAAWGRAYGDAIRQLEAELDQPTEGETTR